MTHVAVVEDNPHFRDEVVGKLERAGHVVHGVGSAAELDILLRRERVDLIVLDLGLPDEDGLSIARRLRSSLPRLGIIMLTARTTIDDRIAGLRDGADNYLCKPVVMNELVVVVEALARRLDVSATGATPAPWELDVQGMRVKTPKGKGVRLTVSETRLLECFASSRGQQASRHDLIDAIEASVDEYDERRLENLISRLRQTLAEDAEEKPTNIIRAIRGRGYLLTIPMVSTSTPLLTPSLSSS
ncbi:MAG: response regulator transcription factor [Rhodocyclaceae bacterium]|nr:response regulator transcription factor [Rhodocyclaceae bacterium]MDZ4214631.1 response regulator transcription factor [Rhodocyclaceae bacterium]